MLKIFLPFALFESVQDIKPERLIANGIRALILDLDDTLSPTHTLLPEEDTVRWVRSVEAAGIKLLVLSNNSAKRVGDYCRTLGVPCLTRAKKPLPGGFRRALQVLGEDAEHTAVIGDQLYTDILGANLTGMLSLAVKPAGSGAVLTVRLKRIFERPLWHKFCKSDKHEL